MIAFALFVVLLVALMTTAVLSYFVYDRTLSGLVNSRFEFIAKELKTKIEAGIDLGLPLGQLENIDELLRQEKDRDSSLVAISIINTDGSILFDTGVGRIGQSAPLAWAQYLSHTDLSSDEVHFGESEIGVPLFTSFGKLVGILLVSYSKTFYVDKRLGVVGELGTIILAVLSAAGVVGAVVVLVVSRPLDTAVARLRVGLDALRHRVGLALPDEPEPAADLAHDSEVERELLQAITSLERAEQQISADVASLAPVEARS